MIAGRYEVLRRLGQGGMGTVYQAKDHRLMREVAIKVLMAPDQDGDDTGTFYFQREARAAAALQHPGIVQIFDYSGPDEKPAFIVMELVRGETLHHLLEAHHPLPESIILSAAQEIADALAHAHEHDVIHRDIKPGNVLVDESGRIALTDFGLAKAYQDPERLGQTVAGRHTEVFGTPGFLAPEQVLREESGPESDVFSLGALLFALATGDSPFRVLDPVETLRRIADVEYQPLRTHRPDLSPELEALLDRCLVADVLDRPDAREIAEQAREQLRKRKLADARACVREFLRTGAVAGDPTGGALAKRASPEPIDEIELTQTRIDPFPGPVEATAAPMAHEGSDTTPAASMPERTEIQPALPSLAPTEPAPLHPADTDATSVAAQVALAEPLEATPTQPDSPQEVPRVERSPQTDPTGLVDRRATGAVGSPRRGPWRRGLYAMLPVLLLIGWWTWQRWSPPNEPAQGEPAYAADEVVSPPAGSSPGENEEQGAAKEPAPAAPKNDPRAVAETDDAAEPPASSRSTPDPLNEPQPTPPAQPTAEGHQSKAGREQRTSLSKSRRAPKKSAPPVQVEIAVNPWGTIYLDGEKVGNAPHVRHLTAPAGRHKVRVVHPTKGKLERVVWFGKESFVLFDFDEDF